MFGSMSGLPESGRGWAIYEYTLLDYAGLTAGATKLNLCQVLGVLRT
jgi:hypothetical protein